jgi:protein SCO1/2
VSNLRTLSASLALLLAGSAALNVATDGFQAFTSEAARRLAVQREPVRAPPVALQLQSGAHTSLAGLQGRWLLIDFIYTRCASVCLALGGEFAQLQQQLAAPIAAGRLQLLSISFDPEHDTPAELAAWLRRSGQRGEGWLAARPLGRGDLKRLEHTFGVTVIPDGLGGYTHNAALHLLDPQGRLVEIFDAGAPASAAVAVQQRMAGGGVTASGGIPAERTRARRAG